MQTDKRKKRKKKVHTHVCRPRDHHPKVVHANKNVCLHHLKALPRPASVVTQLLSSSHQHFAGLSWRGEGRLVQFCVIRLVQAPNSTQSEQKRLFNLNQTTKKKKKKKKKRWS
jgi:hypothetical protein